LLQHIVFPRPTCFPIPQLLHVTTTMIMNAVAATNT
jgi:hypothetical protein